MFTIAESAAITCRMSSHHRIDELGEMREGFAAGVLLSQDFTKIDQHLWAAFSCGLESHPQLSGFRDYLTPPPPPKDEEIDGYEDMKLFCFQQMKKCRDTPDLVVKKFALLVCICLLEPTQNYYRQKSKPEVFEPWLEHLQKNVDIFMFGQHKHGEKKKCKSVFDSKYPNMASFVADMTSFYVNM